MTRPALAGLVGAIGLLSLWPSATIVVWALLNGGFSGALQGALVAALAGAIGGSLGGRDLDVQDGA